MKWVALSLILLLAALLSACAIAPTDTSDIKFGATRATVEGVLGKPVKSMQTDTWRIDTYKYNKGYTPSSGSGGGRDNIHPGVLIMAAVIAPIAHGIRYADQRGDIEVAYGPDDTVIYHGSIGSARLIERARQGDAEAAIKLVRQLAGRGDKEAARELALLSMQHSDEAALELALLTDDEGLLQMLADRGNSKAAYELYEHLLRVSRRLYDKLVPGTGSTAWRWLCRAADSGFTKGQSLVARWHRTDLSPSPGWEREEEFAREAGIRPDNRVAYLWYTLAARNGDDHAQNLRDWLVHAVDMTADEIAQAEQWARDWKPGECGAEGRTAKSAK